MSNTVASLQIQKVSAGTGNQFFRLVEVDLYLCTSG